MSGTELGPQRFEEVVEQTASSLLAVARRLAPDPATAEDLVQETYLRAWRAREQFRGDAAPSTWLHRILQRVALDRFRRAGREELVDEVEDLWRDDSYSVVSEAVVERASDRDELRDALIHLPYTYRAAVLLHDVEGWTAAEIAETLEIGLPLAKQRIRRGRMALVTELSRGGERRVALDGVVLRCWDARARVSDYLDDELTVDERSMLESHLATCPTCPPLYHSLVGIREALGALRDPDTVVPPALVERIRSAGRLAGS